MCKDIRKDKRNHDSIVLTVNSEQVAFYSIKKDEMNSNMSKPSSKATGRTERLFPSF